MDINPIVLSIPIYFLLIGIELLIQFFTHKKLYRLTDAITNINCGITEQITGVFVKAALIGGYQYVFEHWSLFEIPVNWWSITLLFLGVDFCYYWAHRMSHEVNIMWGGHVVHHQSEDYNFSVALRQGSFQKFWTFWFYLPLAFLGFDTLTFLLVSALNTVYQFWIHTETIGKLPKPIEWIFNTPSHHRVHHGRDPKYIDRNHAGSLIIWDRIFGTFQEEEEKPTYGITKQIASWNPIKANLQHYIDMVKQLFKTPGLTNKFKVIINKPGWQPKELGGYQSPPEIGNDYRKFTTRPSTQTGIYVLVQFIIILGATAGFLFGQESFNLADKIFFAVYIILSVITLGLLLENTNQKWNFLEYIRLCLFALSSLYFKTDHQVFIVIMSLSFISFISMIFIHVGKFVPKKIHSE